MKNLKTTCLTNSWMVKTVVKVFPRGKGFTSLFNKLVDSKDCGEGLSKGKGFHQLV